MKKMGSKKPMKATPRPRWKPQAIVFEIVTNKKFDMIIMLFIGFNMLTMTMDHYQQKETFTKVLDYLNMIFIVIFSTECLMKVFALRYHYFTEPWNLFDLVVVVLSILGKFAYDHAYSYIPINRYYFRFGSQRYHRKVFRITNVIESGTCS